MRCEKSAVPALRPGRPSCEPSTRRRMCRSRNVARSKRLPVQQLLRSRTPRRLQPPVTSHRLVLVRPALPRRSRLSPSARQLPLLLWLPLLPLHPPRTVRLFCSCLLSTSIWMVPKPDDIVHFSAAAPPSSTHKRRRSRGSRSSAVRFAGSTPPSASYPSQQSAGRYHYRHGAGAGIDSSHR